MKALPWVKVWWDWYATRAHIGLSPKALHTGPFLLQLANAGERDESGAAWITSGDDGVTPGVTCHASVTRHVRDDDGQKSRRAVTIEAMARASRWPVEDMRDILAELVAAGTMTQRADGAYGFPKFSSFQESPAARRKRRQRERERTNAGHLRDGKRDSHGTSHDKRTEDRELTKNQTAAEELQRNYAQSAAAVQNGRESVQEDSGAAEHRPPPQKPPTVDDDRVSDDVTSQPMTPAAAGSTMTEIVANSAYLRVPRPRPTPELYAQWCALHERRREIAKSEGLDLPEIASRSSIDDAFARAVDSRGFTEVLEVAEWAWRAACNGEIERRLVSAMFVRDAFEAIRDRWKSVRRPNYSIGIEAF